MLRDVGKVVESGSNLKELFRALYTESRRLVNTSNFALALYNDHTDTLTFPLIFDQGEREEPCSIRLSNSRGLVSRVLASQTPLLIHNLPENGITVETDPICPDYPICSWLSVPIRNPTLTGERARGVIVVWSDQPNAFDDRQLQRLSAVGARAAIAIDNARRHNSALTERIRVIEAEERIRKMLARDLHDGPIQLVSGIMMRLDFCQKALERDPALLPEQISYMQELAEHALHQMRTMLLELRPMVLETQGLGAALQVLLERRQKTVKTTALTLNVETCRAGGEISRQEAKVEAAVFAIVQEAVNNALKHAQADHVEVHLKETPTAIYTTIVDDGKGFDVDKVGRGYEQQGSLGLVNIRERAESIGGELEIKSVPGRGTRISIGVRKAE
jgi:signal transduction histidine kinase